MSCLQQIGAIRRFDCLGTLVMLAEGTAGVCMPEGRGQAGATAEHIIKQLSPPYTTGLFSCRSARKAHCALLGPVMA